jgi:hypothetical protein
VADTDPDSFVAALPADVREIVNALRDVIRQAIPAAKETIVWGGLSYHRPDVGGRVKGAVCQIGAKGGHVRLDFIHGIHLADPHRLLEGDQKSKRSLRIDSVWAAERPEVAALIREAALVPERWK